MAELLLLNSPTSFIRVQFTTFLVFINAVRSATALFRLEGGAATTTGVDYSLRLTPMAEAPTGVICTHCGRPFASIRGLGVHARRAHPEQYHRAVAVEDKGRKRWTASELATLARLEVDLLGSGVSATHINLALLEAGALEGRTVESIKGVRRKPSYRSLVKDLTAERLATNQPRNSPVGQDELVDDESWSRPIIEFLRSLEIGSVGQKGTPLHVVHILSAREAALRGDLEGVRRALDEHAFAVVGDPSPSGRRWTAPRSSVRLSRRQRRRQEYAMTQKRWKKDRGRVAKDILNGKWPPSEVAEPAGLSGPSRENLQGFWKSVFETESLGDSRPVVRVRDPQWNLVEPIGMTELSVVLSSASPSAPGLDKVELRHLRRADRSHLLALFNLWLLSEELPKPFRLGRTTLIPKCPHPTSAGEFRPITVLSTLVRVFHRILARRLFGNLPLDVRQKAFIPVDGCAESIALLDGCIAHSTKSLKPLCLATLDVAKAFDSVSHVSVLRAAERLGVPKPLLTYVASCYTEATTDVEGARVGVRRGVRQGDPLSPWLFNAVLDEVMATSNRRVGAALGPHVMDYLAYADDLVLLSNDPAGLQTKLEQVSSALAKAGMHLNLAKCASLTIGVQGKRKRWYVNQSRTFSIRGSGHLTSMGPEDTFKYLGIRVGSAGKQRAAVESDLRLGLERLARAPLKPQQRVEILRTYLLPRFSHRLVLSRGCGAMLKRLDLMVRRSLRDWLHLPSDVSTAWFHANVKDGGLGIPSLRVVAPSMTQSRQDKLARSGDPVVLWCVGQKHFTGEARRAHRLTVRNREGICVTTPSLSRSLWRQRLTETFDGKCLKGADRVPRTHEWIRMASNKVPGWTWSKAMAIRSGSVYTRARAARAREGSPVINCQGHCGSRETIAHILQQCSKTHGARIERHNFIVSRLRGLLEDLGYSMTLEPVIPSGSSFLKPDLVGRLETVSAGGQREVSILVLDVQVVATENILPLRERYLQKVRKYAVPDVEAYCSSHLASSNPMRLQTHGITVTWNGILAKESVAAMVSLGISMANICKVAADAVFGSVRILDVYRRATLRGGDDLNDSW